MTDTHTTGVLSCLVSSPTSAARRVSPGERLTIGRIADMILSNDPYLHRLALAVECDDDHVVLTNVGSSLRAVLVHERTRTVTHLAPGGRCALFEGRTTVTLRTASHEHELRVEVRVPGPVGSGEIPAPRGALTRRPHSLTDDQRLMLAALAEPLLLDPTTSLADLPPNRAVAERLGIGRGFNGRLDRLCAAVSRLGVEGLEPVASDDPYAEAASAGQSRKNRRRRERLVEWALENNVVGVEDLDALDAR